MAEQLKEMSGDEFVTKLLAGERDFRKIHLEHGYRLSIPAVSPTQEYFYRVAGDNSQVKEYRLDVSGSNLSGLNATCLYLPYITAIETDFKFATLGHAQFYGGDLRKANFFNADLTNATFFQANVEDADFRQANLTLAGFQYANLADATFNLANLAYTDLRARNLSLSHGFEQAHFLETKINKEDQKMMAKRLKERTFFVPGD